MYKKIEKFVNDFQISSSVLLSLGILVGLVIFIQLPGPISTYVPALERAQAVVMALIPIWFPVFLGYLFWSYWIVYVRTEFIRNQECILLEIRLPKEITRTPQAMENVFQGLHIKSGETTFIDRWWKGKVRPWFSAELVSIEGNIRFFIWTRASFRKNVESQIYSQYPDVEIHIVDDYTVAISPNLEGYDLWGANFILAEPDPYPIKTYLDYGLDKEDKEERKVDPLASVLEFMASIGKGEQAWIQIIFQKYNEKIHKNDWKKQTREEVDKMMHRKSETRTPAESSETGFPRQAVLSEGDKKQIEALERSISKLGFSCGIRGIYVAEENKFDGSNIPALINSFNHFKSEHLNNFKPSDYLDDFDFPWQDFKGREQFKAKKKVLEAYKRRNYFYPPFKEKPFVLNSEELATLFHFPGWVVQPPTLERIPSRKAEPPSDLPT